MYTFKHTHTCMRSTYTIKNTQRQDTGASSSWGFEERFMKRLYRDMAGIGERSKK